MPINAIVAGPALTAAVKTNLVQAYDRALAEAALFEAVVETTETSDKLSENLVQRESAPLPQRKDKGDRTNYGSTKYKSYNIVNRRWEVGIAIHRDDLADDQTGELKTEPSRLGARMAQLRTRVLYQLILSTSDPKLLPSVPLAADGASYYSATNGAGGDRFGVSGGNIVSGQTMTTAANIRQGVLAGIIRIGSYLDSEDEPIYDIDDVKNVIMAVPFSVYDLYLEAFKQELAAGRSVTGDFPNDALSQFFKERRFNLQIFPSPRITTATDAHVWIKSPGGYKSIKWQPREPLALTPHATNAGDQFEDDYMRWKISERWGMGLGEPVNSVIVKA